jgi:hypothetical protein
MTLARGARQLVVQLAFETTFMLESYSSSLTPITNMGASGDGAETMTFFAPPFIKKVKTRLFTAKVNLWLSISLNVKHYLVEIPQNCVNSKLLEKNYREVGSGLLLCEENSGGLDDVISSGGGPRDVVGVPLAENCDLLAINDLHKVKTDCKFK